MYSNSVRDVVVEFDNDSAKSANKIKQAPDVFFSPNGFFKIIIGPNRPVLADRAHFYRLPTASRRYFNSTMTITTG